MSFADLPAEIILQICSHLSCCDIANVCTSLPHWRWVLESPAGIRFFLNELPKWKWLDQRLARLLVTHSPSSFFNNLIDAAHYRNERYVSFHQRWSCFLRFQQIEAVQCLLLGPAVDTPHYFSGFFNTMLAAMDLVSDDCLQALRRECPPIGWTGHGIPIRIPMSGKNNHPGQTIVCVTTLHARDKRARLVQSSRIQDSFIIDSGQLTPAAASVIKSTDFVLYAIDSRRHSTVWEETRHELTQIASALTSKQTLLVLGLGPIDQDSSTCDLLPAIEIIHQLSGIDDGPLARVQTNWRVWCTTSECQQYTNLNEIFQWAFIDVVSKRQPKPLNRLKSVWNYIPKLF